MDSTVSLPTMASTYRTHSYYQLDEPAPSSCLCYRFHDYYEFTETPEEWGPCSCYYCTIDLDDNVPLPNAAQVVGPSTPKPTYTKEEKRKYRRQKRRLKKKAKEDREKFTYGPPFSHEWLHPEHCREQYCAIHYHY